MTLDFMRMHNTLKEHTIFQRKHRSYIQLVVLHLPHTPSYQPLIIDDRDRLVYTWSYYNGSLK